jgi:3-oxoacyl-[acyl-carrier-protein] synthase II
MQQNIAVPFSRQRIFLVGCGVVAPGASNLQEFLKEVWNQNVSLQPESVLNNAFLVGKPKFDFNQYKSWICERHAPNKFTQLTEKSGENVQMAIGATIDALSQAPQLEAALKALDSRVAICMGSGLGDLSLIFQEGNKWEDALWNWNHFWAAPERNQACASFLKGELAVDNAPENPNSYPADSRARMNAWAKWDSFWAEKSPLLRDYIAEFSEIEGTPMGAEVASDKLKIIRAKAKACKQLQEKYGCPTPPWESVSPNLLWNLPNGPAAQLSMLLGIHGSTWNANGACATFGLLLNEAIKEIQTGQADAAIVGTVDNTPPPQVVSAFYSARVLATGQKVGTPLCEMRGTHVAGGACVWILVSEETLKKHGLEHNGIEILGIGISSDAEHIITPSPEGPKLAIRKAIQEANIEASHILSWDLHATGTPGDFSELRLIDEFVSKNAVISARKGLFGHGMGSNGGWELTAQLLGPRRETSKYVLPPCGISSESVHSTISTLPRRFALDKPVDVQTSQDGLICGKLSMGVGGITSCVIARILQH